MQQQKRKGFDLGLLKTFSFWSTIGLSLVIMLVYVLSRPGIALIPALNLLEIIEAKTLDLRFHLRGEIEPRENIVIVAVDEKTEDELGRWQSSGRQWLARFLNILQEGKTKVIGFDLNLAEPDAGTGLSLLDDIRTYSLEHLPQEIAGSHDLFSYLETLKVSYNYDLQLARAIQDAGNIILGLYFLDAAGTAHLTPEKREAYRQIIEPGAYAHVQFPSGITPAPLRLRRYFGVEPNLPIFSEAARSFGHFNVVPDRDGYIRFGPLLVEYDGKYYPSLTLEVAKAFLNPPLPPIIHALGEEGAGNVETIELGDILIPCDEEGKLLINYYGPARMFTHYSLSDVILGKVPPYRFTEKIVLLGITSKIMQDEHSVPFQSGTYPGVEINATIIENIIRRDFLSRPEWTILIEAMMILLLGLILGIVRHRRSPIWGVWAALISVIVIAGFAHVAFLFGKIWLNVTFPFLFILIDYLTMTSYKYFTEARQKREIKHAFQHYVAPTIVEHMLNQVDDLKLGGERKELTALFCDIRGFTSISERMSPEDLVSFLNEYLTEMAQIVLRYEGTVDKYMGDAIMAFYGAPIAQADHTIRACKTAIDMVLRLKELSVGWEARGLPELHIGVGINSGEMSVGNMGSRERFDYTIMGDHVNLASRLEGINKQYGTNIVISEFTQQYIEHDPFTLRELDTVRVKGKVEPVTIYELLGYGNFYVQKQDLINEFHEGLHAYKNRHWERALALFQGALAIDPDDTPSQMYVDRCAEYLKNPPPDDWDSVFVMETK